MKKIGIITAMQEEFSVIEELMSNVEIINKYNLKIYSGIINNKEVDTDFVSNNELEVYNIPKNIVDVKIGQIGLYNKALSYSNVYNISKLDN